MAGLWPRLNTARHRKYTWLSALTACVIYLSQRTFHHQRRAPAALALASSGGGGQFRFGWLGQLAPAVVLLGGLAGIHFWHQSQLAAEIADIDTQVLLDELPPNAYLDKGFGAWLVPPTK